jgi:hypothetical protein
LTNTRPANPITIRRNSRKKTGHSKIQGVYIERSAFSGHLLFQFVVKKRGVLSPTLRGVGTGETQRT